MPGSGYQIRCRQYRNDPLGERHTCSPPKNSKSNPVPIDAKYHPECKRHQPDPPKPKPPPRDQKGSWKNLTEAQRVTYNERKRLIDHKQKDEALEKDKQLKLAEERDEGARAQIRADYEKERLRRERLRDQYAEKRQRGKEAKPEEPRVTLPGTAFTRTRTQAERAEQERAGTGSQRRRREDSDSPGEQARKRRERDDRGKEQRRKDRDMWE